MRDSAYHWDGDDDVNWDLSHKKRSSIFKLPPDTPEDFLEIVRDDLLGLSPRKLWQALRSPNILKIQVTSPIQHLEEKLELVNLVILRIKFHLSVHHRHSVWADAGTPLLLFPSLARWRIRVYAGDLVVIAHLKTPVRYDLYILEIRRVGSWSCKGHTCDQS